MIDVLENVEKIGMPSSDDKKKELAASYIKDYKNYISLLRVKGKESLFTFNSLVLGVDQGGRKVKLGGFHKELCTFVQNNRTRKKIILIPRGHLKSTLITIGYSTFRIVEDINIRILIMNNTWQMAVDFLTEIKNHLQRNETLIECYGKLAENPLEWSQDRITLQRSDHGVKGPTVWAAGIESNLVGSHPDLIIMDDLVTRESTETNEAMQKIILKYKDALDLLEPGGQLIIIGTRWADRDFYEWILNPDNRISTSFDTMIRPAFQSDFPLDTIFGPDGDVLIRDHLWPEKFSFAELKSRYIEKGPYEFSCQYNNNPVPDESAIFKREWFKYAETGDWRLKRCTSFMTIDPALSLKKEADFTGIIITDVDEQGNILIKAIERGKVAPRDLINFIFTLYGQFHPNFIGLETVAFQKTLSYSLSEEMVKRGIRLPLVEIKYNDRTKDERIKGLQPLYANGKIYHNKEVLNLNFLEDELTRYPKGRHDDLLDSLSMQLELIVPPKKNHSSGDGRYHKKYLYGNSDETD